MVGVTHSNGAEPLLPWEHTGQQATIYDSSGRVVRTTLRGPGVEAWDGYVWHAAGSDWYIEQETEFDSLGRVARVSVPWMTGDPISSRRYHEFHYDGANRLATHTTPWNSAITYTYAINVTAVTDSAGTSLTQVDALGRRVLVTDKIGIRTTYTYGPFSGLRQVTNAGEVTTTVRDAYGRVRESYDSDRHESTIDYNGFGDVVATTDALHRDYKYEYDALGRVVRRDDPDGGTTWEYDFTHGIGKIARVISPAGHVREYKYNDHSQLEYETLSIGPETFASTFTYDGNRLTTIRYPDADGVAPLVVRREYDAFGNVIGVRDELSGTSLWTLDYVDNAGRPTRERFGSGTFMVREYVPESGALRNVMTGLGPATLQDLRYTYDDRLNVKSRTDALQKTANYMMGESFRYDALDRLVCAGFVHVPLDAAPSVPPEPSTCDLALEYRGNGNIDFKSDVGGYTYDPTRPHAVKTAGGKEFDYDAVGNQILRPGMEIGYTAFDLPSFVNNTDDGTEFHFDYDGDQRRIRKTGPTIEETIYFGDLYERVRDDHEQVKHRYYVAVGSATLVITRAEGQDDEHAYIHPDTLGSPDIVTDASGSVVEQHSYDAFGARRNPKWGQPDLPYPKGVNMTFTGHEPDHDLGLVNMKGRIYDPKYARFLQTDPIVSRPWFSQGWNAYSYVLNNPLKYVDPSGFAESDATFGGIKADGSYSFDGAQIEPSQEIVDDIRAEQEARNNVCGPVEQPNAANPAPDPGHDGYAATMMAESLPIVVASVVPVGAPGMPAVPVGAPGAPLPGPLNAPGPFAPNAFAPGSFVEPPPARPIVPIQAPSAPVRPVLTPGAVLGPILTTLATGITFSGDADITKPLPVPTPPPPRTFTGRDRLTVDVANEIERGTLATSWASKFRSWT